jgi:hypothetical protein
MESTVGFEPVTSGGRIALLVGQFNDSSQGASLPKRTKGHKSRKEISEAS